MFKLIGAVAIVVAVILLFNPVILGIPLNSFGSCFVIGLILGGLVAILAG
jgi:hypothetical protein